MEPKVCAAIRLAKKRGKTLARNHPELARKYTTSTLEKLAEEYSVDYDRSIHVARNTVWYALSELMDPAEQREIAKQHQDDALAEFASIAGSTTFERGVGAFGMNEKDRKVACKKGGETSSAGKKSYIEGTGIAALTDEQRIEQGKKNAIARGQIPYDGIEKTTYLGRLTEKQYIINLKLQEQLSWNEITAEVNSVFRNNRKAPTLNTMWNQCWKISILGPPVPKEKTPYKGEKRKTSYGTLDEKEYILRLRHSDLTLTWREIAQEVNSVFGTKRDYKALRQIYNRMWKYQFKE